MKTLFGGKYGETHTIDRLERDRKDGAVCRHPEKESLRVTKGDGVRVRACVRE